VLLENHDVFLVFWLFCGSTELSGSLSLLPPPLLLPNSKVPLGSAMAMAANELISACLVSSNDIVAVPYIAGAGVGLGVGCSSSRKILKKDDR